MNDLALVGNAIYSAVVNSAARVVWSCFPKMDGDPIFNELLNNNSEFQVRQTRLPQGFFDVVVDNLHKTEQEYESGLLLILKTRLITKE